MSKNKRSVMNVELVDKAALYKAYMPFLNRGGIFIAMDHPFEIEDSLFIRLKLPDEPEPMPVACQVVWLAPAVSGATQGVGLQFMDDNDLVKTKIETFLAGTLNSDKSTDTM